MEMAIPVSIIEDIIVQELKCPICLDTIQNTSTVTACLHRFCADCLHKSLRGNLNTVKEHHDCPSCRFKLPSKRSTRADTGFDELIQMLTSAYANYEATATTTIPSPCGLLRQTSSISSVGADESFDIRQFQHSHAKTVAEFRAKQKEKVREMRQQHMHQNKQQQPTASAPSHSQHQQPRQSASETILLTRQRKHPNQNTKPVVPPPARRANVARSSPESLPRVNFSIFPFISVEYHLKILKIHALQEDSSNSNNPPSLDSLSGTKRPRSPSLSTEGEPSVSAEGVKYESLPNLALPYLRTPPSLTILALKQYITARLELTPVQVQHLEIVFLDLNQGLEQTNVSETAMKVDEKEHEEVKQIVLDDHLTVADIAMTLWRARGKFELFYRLNSDYKTSNATNNVQDPKQTNNVSAVPNNDQQESSHSSEAIHIKTESNLSREHH